jgi:hypothetical protein
MKAWLLLVTIGSDYPQVLPGVTFENEGECERADAIIEAKARQNSWLIRYRCFHSGKPPLWPIEAASAAR